MQHFKRVLLCLALLPSLNGKSVSTKTNSQHLVYVCTDGRSCLWAGVDVYFASKGLCRAKDINHIPWCYF